MRDTFKEFDDDLSCYTYNNGLGGWLARRMGKNERTLAKFIRMRSYDDSFKQSIDADLDEDNESEKDVKFANTVIHKGGGHGGGGHAAGGHGSGSHGTHGAHGSSGKGAHAATHASHGSHGRTHYVFFFGHHIPGWEMALILMGSIVAVAILVAVFCSLIDS